MKLTLLSILAIVAGSLALRAGEIKVVGSDLLNAPVTKLLAAYAKEHNLDVEIDLFGSIPAMSQLRNDEAQLGLVSHVDDTEFEHDGMEIVPFAYQVAVVVVNEDNRLSELSLEQLAGIFGTSSETYYTRWGELGLSGGMATRSIQPIVMSRPGSVVVELFKYKALDRSPLKPNIVMIEGYEGNSELIAGDSGAIAIFPYKPDDNSLKALSVSGDDENGFAFGPTRENVFYGDYPMRLPFYLVFKPENKNAIDGLLRFMLSPEMSQSLEKNGFMPLPENVRKRTILELDSKS